MKIKIKYFGQLKAITGKDAEVIDTSAEETIIGLITSLSRQYGPAFKTITLVEGGGYSLQPTLIVLLDGLTVDKNSSIRLTEGQEISLLTPIAGG